MTIQIRSPAGLIVRKADIGVFPGLRQLAEIDSLTSRTVCPIVGRSSTGFGWI